MAKNIKPQPNVIIIDPETDEQTTETDMSAKKYIPVTKKGEPIPQTSGKGRKECPSCHMFIPPSSDTCPNPECNHVFEKGVKKSVVGGRTITKTKASDEHPHVGLLRVLKGRGFDVKVSIDALDPDATPVMTMEKQLNPLLEYMGHYNRNGKFELSLDQLLGLMKIPLSK